MTKRVVNVSLIDPVFTIPPGAEDEFEYTETPLATEDYDTSVTSEPEQEGLATPDTFTIISQKIRRGKGNHQVVDVVFETEIIDGADKYEIKVTKV